MNGEEDTLLQTLRHKNYESSQNVETSLGLLSNSRKSSLAAGSLILTWQDICVWVSKKRSYLPWGPQPELTQILNNVSGIARSGKLIAIMGASGAGKTTLLATISRRIKGKSRGEIRVNGELVSSDVLRCMSGFVPQQDLAVESLTVNEHMEFMGRLKVARSMKNADRQRWVRSLLTELSLIKCEHTRLSSLSGGERKRLSLAVQLLTNPAILFCDEPTTGLDSYSAAAVVEKLKELSSRGMAVICTIHQPASGVFEMFHELILLANGRLAYQGGIKEANDFFASMRLVCPATYNAADFYISQLAIRPGREEFCTKQVKTICDEFESSPQGIKLRDSVQEIKLSHGSLVHWNQQDSVEIYKRRKIERSSWFTQLYWVMWRQAVSDRRNYSEWMVRLIAFLFVGVVISVPFVGILHDQRGIQNTEGLLYLIVVETIFTFTYSVFNTFPREMPILLREISDALYKPAPYYISKMIMMVPRCVIAPFFYTLTIFCVVGLQGGVLGFFTLLLPVIMCATSATAYGCMMSAMFESVSTASLLSVPLDLVTLTYSGLFLKFKSLPVYLSWIRYISQFYYANEAVNIAQWNQVTTIECSEIPNAPCLHSGTEVLNAYGFDADDFPIDFLGLFGIYCFAHTIGFLSVLRRSKAQAIY